MDRRAHLKGLNCVSKSTPISHVPSNKLSSPPQQSNLFYASDLTAEIKSKDAVCVSAWLHQSTERMTSYFKLRLYFILLLSLVIISTRCIANSVAMSRVAMSPAELKCKEP